MQLLLPYIGKERIGSTAFLHLVKYLLATSPVTIATHSRGQLTAEENAIKSWWKSSCAASWKFGHDLSIDSFLIGRTSHQGNNLLCQNIKRQVFWQFMQCIDPGFALIGIRNSRCASFVCCRCKGHFNDTTQLCVDKICCLFNFLQNWNKN